jgi:hypothetical protein
METRRIIIEKENITRVIQLTFESGVLTVSEVQNVDTENETVNVFFVQPHKNNADGSKSAWESAEQSFSWFETKTSEIIE